MIHSRGLAIATFSIAMLGVLDGAEDSPKKKQALDARDVKSIDVSYHVHFTRLSIHADDTGISYLLALQEPSQPQYQLASSAQTLQRIAEQLFATALFRHRPEEDKSDFLNNPPYIITVHLRNDSTIVRAAGHHDVFGRDEGGSIKPGKHEDVARWLNRFNEPLSKASVKDASEIWK